jgi:hypothetical protein
MNQIHKCLLHRQIHNCKSRLKREELECTQQTLFVTHLVKYLQNVSKQNKKTKSGRYNFFFDVGNLMNVRKKQQYALNKEKFENK